MIGPILTFGISHGPLWYMLAIRWHVVQIFQRYDHHRNINTFNRSTHLLPSFKVARDGKRAACSRLASRITIIGSLPPSSMTKVLPLLSRHVSWCLGLLLLSQWTRSFGCRLRLMPRPFHHRPSRSRHSLVSALQFTSKNASAMRCLFWRF